MASLLENSRKSVIHVASSQVVLRAMGMVATVILARNLTVEDYGVYNLFFGAILVFNFFTNLGLVGSLQRFLAEYAKKEKYGVFFRTFFFSMGYRVISGIVVFVIAVALFDWFSVFFGVSVYKYEFILFCLGTYALFHIDFLVVALNSLFLHSYTSLVQLIYHSIRLVSIVIFLLLLEGGGLTEVFIGELFAFVIGAILLWLVFNSKAYLPRKEKSLKDKTGIEWKRFLRFTAYNAATIPGGVLFNQAMDFFVVAAMATTSQLGIYALGSRASNMLLSIMPQNILQTVVRPVFYHRYYSVGDKVEDINRELNRMFRSLVVLIAAVLIPTIVLVIALAEPLLVFVFKSKFSEATPVFIMLMFFNVFKILELPSDLVLQAIEKVQARLYAQIFAVYNVIAAILLMPEFGLLGVAFATGSAAMGKCVFMYVMARYYTGISINWGAILCIGINTAIAAGVTVWVSHIDDSPLWMFISLIAGAVVYVGVSAVNHFLDNYEKNLVNKIFKRRIFKV